VISWFQILLLQKGQLVPLHHGRRETGQAGVRARVQHPQEQSAGSEAGGGRGAVRRRVGPGGPVRGARHRVHRRAPHRVPRRVAHVGGSGHVGAAKGS
jgi:hypothetical protein